MPERPLSEDLYEYRHAPPGGMVDRVAALEAENARLRLAMAMTGALESNNDLLRSENARLRKVYEAAVEWYQVCDEDGYGVLAADAKLIGTIRIAVREARDDPS